MAPRGLSELKAAVITISDSVSRGEGEDESGPLLAEATAGIGAEPIERDLVPDDRERIGERLRHWADEAGCELILTTGGTGFAPSDVTPEATRGVIDREAPGIAEAMRSASREHTPNWLLSRGVAGIRGRSLIVNFPGSPRSIGPSWDAIAGVLPHALELLAGGHQSPDHGQSA
jgi:molybdopterin adenylyltransferase